MTMILSMQKARSDARHVRNLAALAAVFTGFMAVSGQVCGASFKSASTDRTRYHLAVLGEDLNPNGPCALALNDRGQIVGMDGNWKVRPFAALRGLDQTHNFGQFSSMEGRLAASVADINNRGQVVGVFQSETSGAWLVITNYGFLWTHGKVTALKPIDTIPHAINNKGEIAGEHTKDMPLPNQYPSHAVVWRHGKIIDLGPGIAIDINDSGTVVGNPANSDEGLPVGRALCWRGGRVTELRALSSGASRAWAVNNDGLIVGNSDRIDNVTHAVAWRNGRLIDLGAGKFNSRALGVNDSDVIVGAACLGGDDRAVMWRGGKMLDLNQMLIGGAGWTLTEADKINARGQIIAKGQRNGKAYYVLLTPH